MKDKYKGWTYRQRLEEYGRLKREYYEKNGWADEMTYDEFIKRIVDDLGI